MAGSFTSLRSAFAFGCRSSPNGRKVRGQRSIRLMGARAKVSSGRLSVRFRVAKLDLNPCQRGKIKCVGIPRILYGDPVSKDDAKLLFVRRDGKYYLTEVWCVLGKLVVTGEFQ